LYRSPVPYGCRKVRRSRRGLPLLISDKRLLALRTVPRRIRGGKLRHRRNLAVRQPIARAIRSDPQSCRTHPP
jgi:hypothetical protein